MEQHTMLIDNCASNFTVAQLEAPQNTLAFTLRPKVARALVNNDDLVFYGTKQGVSNTIVWPIPPRHRTRSRLESSDRNSYRALKSALLPVPAGCMAGDTTASKVRDNTKANKKAIPDVLALSLVPARMSVIQFMLSIKYL